MAEFLTTIGTSYHIENIIINASKDLVLISPFLNLSKTFYERLKDAAKKNVKITIIYGKDDLKPNERNSLAELRDVQLYYFENLHAKCYFNDTHMVITSMNMYEFSEKNNREMGILIDRSIDKILFENALKEAQSIIQSAEFVELRKSERSFIEKNKISETRSGLRQPKTPRGYCIRCLERIEFNPQRPYCANCYSIWAQYGNPDYTETVCHCCGEYDESSMGKPQCYDCYSEQKGAYKQK